MVIGIPGRKHWNYAWIFPVMHIKHYIVIVRWSIISVRNNQSENLHTYWVKTSFSEKIQVVELNTSIMPVFGTNELIYWLKKLTDWLIDLSIDLLIHWWAERMRGMNSGPKTLTGNGFFFMYLFPKISLSWYRGLCFESE